MSDEKDTEERNYTGNLDLPKIANKICSSIIKYWVDHKQKRAIIAFMSSSLITKLYHQKFIKSVDRRFRLEPYPDIEVRTYEDGKAQASEFILRLGRKKWGRGVVDLVDYPLM